MNSKLDNLRVFDSHCHPQMAQYNEDREEMLKRAEDAGVFMICVGTNLDTSRQAIELAQKNEGMWASVGLHPNDANNFQFSIFNFQKLLEHPKVIAVGEIGLDYYRTPELKKQEKQKEVFEKFLDLAIQYNKPVIIHSRDAAKGTTGRVHADMFPIIENWKLKIENSARPWRAGVAHSFTGSIEDAKKYLELGFYLGFNGIITFARQYDEIVKEVPLERILLETDSPYLTPEPYRGQRNEPVHVVEVAKKIAELKNEPLEKVIEQTTKNCKQLFKIEGF